MHWIEGMPLKRPARKKWLVHRDNWSSVKLAVFTNGKWYVDNHVFFLRGVKEKNLFHRHAEPLALPQKRKIKICPK